MCKPPVNHVCRVSFELLRQDKLFFFGAPWPVLSPKFAGVKDVQIVGKLGVTKSRISVNDSEVMGETALRKQGFVFVLPSVVEQNVKRKPEMDRAELPKTASMKQLTDLMRGIQQQDACDMKVDSAEVMWQESDAIVWNTLAHELETVVECLPAEEDDVKDIEMSGGELRDGFEGVDQETT